jgi:integrase
MPSMKEFRPGRWRIRFLIDGKRNSIHLPKGISKRDRSKFLDRLEEMIVVKKINGTYSADIVSWVAGLSRELLEKLATIGLIKYTEKPDLTLIEIVDQYIERRSSLVSLNTAGIWTNTRGALAARFGERRLSEITAGDAFDFSESTPGAISTRHLYTAVTKRIIKDAIKRELVAVNPFADIKCGVVANPDRARFITRETIARLLEFCEPKLRLAVALSRFGGVRSPTELANLQWSDVIWDTKRIVIRKHKTKRRVIPIFPELSPFMERAYDDAKDGASDVVPGVTYKNAKRTSSSLDYQLKKSIRLAGLERWPRLWHNMRASRQTELEANHPSHVVCAWLGNSPETARNHYLQVTESDFDKASANEGDNNKENPVAH